MLALQNRPMLVPLCPVLPDRWSWLARQVLLEYDASRVLAVTCPASTRARSKEPLPVRHTPAILERAPHAWPIKTT